MKKLKILIADDHQMIREAWALIINNDPRFSVVAKCSNGDEAIQLTKELNPEIVVLDINMEPTSGIEVAEQIRKYSPDTGIVVVTMHTQPSFVKKLMKVGAKGYVTKNSKPQELLDAIVAVSKGNRYICAEMKNNAAEQFLTRR